jgi:hypothetical protein
MKRVDQADPARQLRAILRVGKRELLTTAQIADEWQFPSRESVRHWLKYWKVPIEKRGRIVLVDRRDIQAVSDRQQPKGEGGVMAAKKTRDIDRRPPSPGRAHVARRVKTNLHASKSDCVRIAVPNDACGVVFSNTRSAYGAEIGRTARDELMIACFDSKDRIIRIELLGAGKPCQEVN